MKNNETIQQQIDKKKKIARRSYKYIIPAVLIPLLIITVFGFLSVKWEPKSDPAFEKIVRKAAAIQINKKILSEINFEDLKRTIDFEAPVRDPNENDDEYLKRYVELYMKEITKASETRLKAYQKDPNELGDKDFAKIKELDFIYGEFYSIKFLEKFTSLETLLIINVTYPKNAVPSWMKFLAKFGVYNLNERCVIDLSPLKKLSNLKELLISNAPVNDIASLSKLRNLQSLGLSNLQVSNFVPLKNLTNLQRLDLREIKISDFEPIKNLTNLQELVLIQTNVSDLEPIKGMTKLETLNLLNTQISDLEPIKDMINLKTLNISITMVSNLEPLRNLKNLEQLELDLTQVTDLEPLKELINLREVHIQKTPVSSFRPLFGLTKLEQLWIQDFKNMTYEEYESFKKRPNFLFGGMSIGEYHPPEKTQ